MGGKKRGKGTLIRCVISVYTQMCVHVCFTVYKEAKERKRDRQRADRERERKRKKEEGCCQRVNVGT